MIEFTCPALDVTMEIAPRELVSAHRTTAGTVGYARCACGGINVVAADRLGASDWETLSHGVGANQRQALTPEAA